MWNLKSLHRVMILACALLVPLCPAETVSSGPEAAELVQAVRASENSLHEIDSLYIRIESTSTKTPEGIAARIAELRQRFPDGELEASRFPELKPVSTTILEYAIDETRVRFSNDQRDSRSDLKIWDGKQLMVYEAALHEKQEQYTLGRTPHGFFQDMLASDTS